MTSAANNCLLEYFRCPADTLPFEVSGRLSQDSGFFSFGNDVICFGRSSAGNLSPDPSSRLYDLSADIVQDQSRILLPFDPTEIVNSLRLERYSSSSRSINAGTQVTRIFRQLYYLLRPLFPIAVRKQLQRTYLKGWKKLRFPGWPLDCSVDAFLERLLAIALRREKNREIPFIWFWPSGAQGCAIVTHDVETAAGRDFCATLMDLNDSYGIKSSFQVIPEKRYDVPASFLGEIRSRGFEVNVHDLNHDGHLFDEREEFLRRARKINQYICEFGALGFRSGVLYRKLDWYDAFEFSYDMSVPNVAHLDSQRGGCCTVTPYFVGNVLELPLTTTQDYSLFHILGDYSINLWKQQIDLILEKHGLISFNVHPDYIIEKRARAIYEALLQHLADLRSSRGIWFALPKEVDRWWRDRSVSRVVREGDTWRIEGPAGEGACIAFARLEGERVVYRVESDTVKQATGDQAE